MTALKTALYLHIPFCLQRCTYCDFNTYDGLLDHRSAYVTALRREIHHRAALYPEIEATTLYFGGGTPSLLLPEWIATLIADVRRHFRLVPEAEVTLEANPGTVDVASLSALRAAGVNRLRESKAKSRVVVQSLRMGGAFGGKEVQANAFADALKGLKK